MTEEPKRRRDGRCARYPSCKKLLKPPSVRRAGVDQRQYDREPFCSSHCCKVWYGLEENDEPRSVGRPPKVEVAT